MHARGRVCTYHMCSCTCVHADVSPYACTRMHVLANTWNPHRLGSEKDTVHTADILALASDQHGCRLLQKHLDEVCLPTCPCTHSCTRAHNAHTHALMHVRTHKGTAWQGDGQFLDTVFNQTIGSTFAPLFCLYCCICARVRVNERASVCAWRARVFEPSMRSWLWQARLWCIGKHRWHANTNAVDTYVPRAHCTPPHVRAHLHRHACAHCTDWRAGMSSLMMDPFGNYLTQKLIEHATYPITTRYGPSLPIWRWGCRQLLPGTTFH